MKTLLKKYRKALKAGKLPIANQIEGIILSWADRFEFERRDAIIEQLTLASI